MASIFEKEPVFLQERPWSDTTDLDALDEQNNRRFDHDEVGFRRAVGLFVCKILDSEMPQDLQYVYMAPGGDHKIVKDLLTPPREHARRFKEMLCITKLLPTGETQTPSEKLALQWYYMTYHRADRAKYVKSGKKLASETIESLTNYFQALFSQTKN